jgi:hypothetical protein
VSSCPIFFCDPFEYKIYHSEYKVCLCFTQLLTSGLTTKRLTSTLYRIIYYHFVFYLFHSNRSVQKCDLLLFKMSNTKLQKTHFLRRYRTKPNTALESKASFVHLNCIVRSAPLRGQIRNSRERKIYLPHSYCK